MNYHSFSKALKEKFGFNMVGLTAYVDQTSEEILFRALFENKTGEYFQKMTDVSFKKALQIASHTLHLQPGASCGFTTTGSTALTQREMEVANIKYNHSWCQQDFVTYWTQVLMNAGSYADDVSPVEVFANHVAGLIAEANENMLWRGNTSLVNPNLNKFDGFLRIIDVAGTAINGNPTSINSGTGITRGNADTILDGMVNLLPAGLDGKPGVFFACGYDTFKVIMQAYYDNNSFANALNPAQALATGSLTHPLYGLPIEAFAGLNGTNRIILGQKENFYIGTDVFGEENSFRLFHCMDNDETRMIVRYKLGTQVAFPNEIVQFTLA